MAKGQRRPVEERRGALQAKILFHEHAIVTLKEKIAALDKPRAARTTKKQKLLQQKLDTGELTPEEARILGYKLPQTGGAAASRSKQGAHFPEA